MNQHKGSNFDDSLEEASVEEISTKAHKRFLTLKPPLDVKGVDLGLSASEITAIVNESRERKYGF